MDTFMSVKLCIFAKESSASSMPCGSVGVTFNCTIGWSEAFTAFISCAAVPSCDARLAGSVEVHDPFSHILPGDTSFGVPTPIGTEPAGMFKKSALGKPACKRDHAVNTKTIITKAARSRLRMTPGALRVTWAPFTVIVNLGDLGVGGPDPEARQSKSLQVPMRRHAKHHRVRQGS
mmetsp:Transcript_55924/g.88614  ORF Transcript_55924/g.88614 Transcript_55924/m.88614 type:complete len:176 (+) Transcript_55924:369-896(+)